MYKLSTMQKNNLNTIISSFFKPFKALVGLPSYKVYPGKIVVQVPYYVANLANKGTANKKVQSLLLTGVLTNSKIESLGLALIYMLNKTSLSSSFSQQKRSLFSRESWKIKQENKNSGKQLLALTTQCELRFVKLRYPYLDSSILAQYLAINTSKYNFTKLQKSVFKNLPALKDNSRITLTSRPFQNSSTSQGVSFSETLDVNGNNDLLFSPPLITGIKIELSGRLTTQRSVPRKTVSNCYTGSFTVNESLNRSLAFSQYTSKNKLGAYTIKVWLSNIT